MIPATLDLLINRGVSFGPLVFVCKNVLDALVPLAGWIPYAVVRRKPGGPLVFDLEPQITNYPGGQITIQFTDEQTMAMPSGSYRWDLILQQPDGDRKGPFIVGRCVVASLITEPVSP